MAVPERAVQTAAVSIGITSVVRPLSAQHARMAIGDPVVIRIDRQRPNNRVVDVQAALAIHQEKRLRRPGQAPNPSGGVEGAIKESIPEDGSIGNTDAITSGY